MSSLNELILVPRYLNEITGIINILKVLIGTNFRDSSDTCGMPDADYDHVDSNGIVADYGRGTTEFPNELFLKHYRDESLRPGAYDDFLTCPSGVWFAAIAHYFMIAVMSWMACEGIHLYFQVVAVLSRPRHKYLTKLSLFGRFFLTRLFNFHPNQAIEFNI